MLRLSLQRASPAVAQVARRSLHSGARFARTRVLTAPAPVSNGRRFAFWALMTAPVVFAVSSQFNVAHAEEEKESESADPFGADDLIDSNDIETHPVLLGEEPAESAAAPSESVEEGEAPKGAFDPETGEINWDCPCLGGMADGPCGEEFKEAFSCFVYSEAEPKGIDCIEKFQHMQDCFRKYPEVYSDEIREESPIGEPETAEAPAADAPAPVVASA